jgi:hypothetical protein
MLRNQPRAGRNMCACAAALVTGIAGRSRPAKDLDLGQSIDDFTSHFFDRDHCSFSSQEKKHCADSLAIRRMRAEFGKITSECQQPNSYFCLNDNEVTFRLSVPSREQNAQ